LVILDQSMILFQVNKKVSHIKNNFSVSLERNVFFSVWLTLSDSHSHTLKVF